MSTNETPAAGKLDDPEYAERFVDRVNDVMFGGAVVSDDAPESLPPVLPDTSGWVQRKPGDVIEAGAPFVVADDADKVDLRLLGAPLALTIEEGTPFTYWTPPPAPVPVWSVLSTDREKPTDAYVNGVPGRYWLDAEEDVHSIAPDGDSLGVVAWSHEVKSVEPLADPSTHVPVERALIGRIVAGGSGAVDDLRTLAALADGNQS